jgi:hypothetical protein
VAGIGSGYRRLARIEPWEPDGENEWVPVDSHRLVSFDGDGHWELCLDYRAGGPLAEPSITYVDGELLEERPVADSFDAFLAGLVDETEKSALRIYADVELDDFARAFAEACGGELTDLGSWNTGVRLLGVNLAGGWAWISANRVPAGYRRSGDEVIVTSETGLRLPNDEACRLLVTFSDAAGDAAREAARGTGYWS